jgi:hypothetical protein
MDTIQDKSNSDNAVSAPLPRLEPGARCLLDWGHQDPGVPIGRHQADFQYQGNSGSELADAIAQAIRAIDHPRPFHLIAQVLVHLTAVCDKQPATSCPIAGAAEDELLAAASRVNDAWDKHDRDRVIRIEGDEREL